LTFQKVPGDARDLHSTDKRLMTNIDNHAIKSYNATVFRGGANARSADARRVAMPATKQDYYQLLGVSKGASEKDIRQAYRRLARQHHPDLNPGDKAAETRFKEIGEAYEVLSDAEKRKKYDRYGHDWQQAEAAEKAAREAGFSGGRWSPGPGGVRFDSADLDDDAFGDLFGNLFGGGAGTRTGYRGRRAAQRGEDYDQPIDVTLDEAFAGSQRTLQVQSADGKLRRLEIKIPPGVSDGSRIRMAGEGGPGVGGGPAGDLYLVVSVRPHPTFRREGDDLHVDVPVPLNTLVLGGEAHVPTLKGTRLALTIPAETQNGRVFRLAGQGMPHLQGGGRGDLYANVKAVLPTNLTERERELFRELASQRSA
jgi:curved DNA-binding protein